MIGEANMFFPSLVGEKHMSMITRYRRQGYRYQIYEDNLIRIGRFDTILSSRKMKREPGV